MLTNLSIHDIRDQLSNYIRSSDRISHCISVAETAELFSKHHGVLPKSAKVAGLYHDIAKEMSPSKLKEMGIENVQEALYESTPSIWHAFVAADVAQHLFHISNPDILDAMTWHTTGKANMSPLAQLLFVADYIEPLRPIQHRDYLESLAKTNLDHATLAITLTSILSLMKKHATIHAITFECYNHYSQLVDSECFDNMLYRLIAKSDQ